MDCAVLESDALRLVLTPNPRYDEEEREMFYRQVGYIGALLIRHGVPVIFDATASRRLYRDRARLEIPRFLEVYVSCPLEVCIARDPKGIYRGPGKGAGVPGLGAVYEAPLQPDLTVQGDSEPAVAAARRILAALASMGYVDEA